MKIHLIHKLFWYANEYSQYFYKVATIKHTDRSRIHDIPMERKRSRVMYEFQILKGEASNGETPVVLEGDPDARSKAEQAIMDIVDGGMFCFVKLQCSTVVTM